MSGGHWEYTGIRIRDGLAMIADDEAVKARWPKLGDILAKVADALYRVEHAMDWDLSGDTEISDDGMFERHALDELREAVKP